MELQTDRLKIVPCTEEVLSAFSTEEYGIGPHIRRHVEELKKDPTLLGWGVWLVINKENETVVGDIGFKGKPNSESVVEVGYGVASSSQGKGYATEAVNEIIRWAFTFDHVHKVIAECLADNTPSVRVLEKLNFRRTGTEQDMIYWELKK